MGAALAGLVLLLAGATGTGTFPKGGTAAWGGPDGAGSGVAWVGLSKERLMGCNLSVSMKSVGSLALVCTIPVCRTVCEGGGGCANGT